MAVLLLGCAKVETLTAPGRCNDDLSCACSTEGLLVGLVDQSCRARLFWHPTLIYMFFYSTAILSTFFYLFIFPKFFFLLHKFFFLFAALQRSHSEAASTEMQK